MTLFHASARQVFATCGTEAENDEYQRECEGVGYMVVGVFGVGSTMCVLLIRNVMVAFDNHTGGVQEEIAPPGGGVMLQQSSALSVGSSRGCLSVDVNGSRTDLRSADGAAVRGHC